MCRTIYVDKNIPRIIAVKALKPVWPAVVFSSLAPVRYRELPIERLPGPRWVRVRNQQCGICGTDLSLLFANVDLSIAPAALPTTNRFYLGHEVVGYVAEVGPQVTQLSVGDRVVMDTRFQGATCLSQEIAPPCHHCAEGNYMRCENAACCHGPKGIGGGWGDGFIAHETELYRVPKALTDDQAMMIEPLSTGVRAVLRRPPAAGQRALIVGSGIIGLNVLQCLRALSPGCHVAIVARYPHQAQMACRLGAAAVIDSSDSYRAIADLTKAKLYRGSFHNQTLLGGFDVVYDCVGSSQSLQNSLRWARAGGTVVLIGIEMRPLKLDLNPIWNQEVDVIGVCAHGAETWEQQRMHTYDIVVGLLLEGQLTTEGLITHRFPLSQWVQAINTATNKRSGSIKVIFDNTLQ